MITLVYGTVWTRVKTEFPNEVKELTKILSVRDPDPSRNEKYISGEWDGVHRFYDSDSESFPTGLLKYLEYKLSSMKLAYTIENAESTGTHAEIPDDLLTDDGNPFRLRDYQLRTIQKVLFVKRGIVRIGTGGGKTEIQAGVAKMLNCRSLTIVQDTRSMLQTADRFRRRGLEDVGCVSGDIKELDAQHVVAMVQSLWAGLKSDDEEVRQLLDSVELLQGDEIHHLGGGIMWQSVFTRCTAAYRVGYSGTPLLSRDPLHNPHPRDMQVIAYTGNPLVNIPSKWLRDNGYIQDPCIYMPKVDKPRISIKRKNYRYIYEDGVVRNPYLNGLCALIAGNCARIGYRPVILVDRIEHGEIMLHRLHEDSISAFFSFGGMRIKQYDPDYQGSSELQCPKCQKAAKEPIGKCKCGFSGRMVSVTLDKYFPVEVDEDNSYVERFKAGEFQVMVGISKVYGESIDMPFVNAFIIAAGGKSYVSTIQRVGRPLRGGSGSDLPVVIFDPRVTAHPYLSSHGRKRADEYQYEEYRVYGTVPSKFLQPLSG